MISYLARSTNNKVSTRERRMLYVICSYIYVFIYERQKLVNKSQAGDGTTQRTPRTGLHAQDKTSRTRLVRRGLEWYEQDAWGVCKVSSVVPYTQTQLKQHGKEFHFFLSQVVNRQEFFMRTLMSAVLTNYEVKASSLVHAHCTETTNMCKRMSTDLS